jgi:ribosome-associated protein
MSPQAAIAITDRIALDETEIAVSFIRASGPGGQNVNKVASAAQLRFDARGSPSLPAAVRERLERIAGARLTKDGEIVITADRFRTQEANRRDAIERLVRMIRQAAIERPVRRPTQPTLGSKLRRLTGKTKRSAVKLHRRKPGPDEG